ncbi:MAG: DUF6838 family protein [Lachnospiraceae bacterium]
MITKIADIKAAVNELLKAIDDDTKVYGNDVVQGYQTPCFFCDLHVKTVSDSKNYNNNAGIAIITYMQTEPDEMDAIEKYDKIREAFGMKLKVKERFINIEDCDYSFVGKDANILQIEVNFSYMDRIPHKVTHETMRTLNWKGKVKE